MYLVSDGVLVEEAEEPRIQIVGSEPKRRISLLRSFEKNRKKTFL